MVLNHVAQRAGAVVITAALFDPERLRRSDLDILHVVAIPDRLEDRVGEAQRDDVLHRLLPEIVVDAVNLVLGKDRFDRLLELSRRLEIGAEGLLDDDARPAVGVFLEAGFFEMLDDLGKDRRWRREIEEVIACGTELGIVLGEPLFEREKVPRDR